MPVFLYAIFAILYTHMQKRTSITLGFIIIGIAAGTVWFLSGGGGSPADKKTQANDSNTSVSFDNDKRISFALADQEGNLVRSRDFKGKVLIVMSWATWCPSCKRELLDLGALQKEFPNDVAAVAINRAEPANEEGPYADALALGVSVLFLTDPEDAFFKAIGGYAMPETLFIRKNGDVAAHERDVLSLDRMRKTVDTILGNKP